MFGHDDKPKEDENHGGDAPATDSDQTFKPNDGTNDAADRDNSWLPPASHTNNNDKTDDSSDQAASDSLSNAANDDHATAPPTSTFSAPSTPAPTGVNDDLIDIKQDALGKLSPLIGHLDQSPDEKFRTLMMMIQASDDQSLVKQAYDTALKIDEEKTRAQALLDIVNEINYFTQNPKAE
jgi:hypothetical protein